MKRGSIIFLQIIIIFIGMGVLAFMLLEPQFEGRNINATFFEIYFQDLFLLYAYTSSIPFFIALYQAFKLLNNTGKNKLFSAPSVKAIQTIKYCALTILGFITLPEAYLLIVRPGDDIAGGVFMGTLIALISIIVATVATVFEKILQNAVDIKSENDLTI